MSCPHLDLLYRERCLLPHPKGLVGTPRPLLGKLQVERLLVRVLLVVGHLSEMIWPAVRSGLHKIRPSFRVDAARLARVTQFMQVRFWVDIG